MASGWRDPVLRGARRIGAERVLRQAQQITMSPEKRRNAQDDAHLELLLRLSLARDATCVDVGANLGAMLATMVELAPDGRHIAFEPLPDLAADLRRRFPAAEVHAAAVSDTAGTATFHRATDALSRSSLEAAVLEGYATTTLEVDVRVLDDTVPDDVEVDLLKIDVEGAELGVLRGAARVLATAPMVVLEHGGPSGASREIHAILTGAGLRIFDMDGGGPYTLDAFLRALVGRRRRWNWVAHR